MQSTSKLLFNLPIRAYQPSIRFIGKRAASNLYFLYTFSNLDDKSRGINDPARPKHHAPLEQQPQATLKPLSPPASVRV